jgi:hypothetical protein
MTKQDMGPLGRVDLLTKDELSESLGHHFSAHLREKYRGIDYLGFAGPGNGTNQITLPGPDSGYAWSYKLISAQLAASSSLQQPINSNLGSVVNPVGAGNICTMVIANTGAYTIEASVTLTGTITAADINNVCLSNIGTSGFVYPGNGNIAGVSYPLGPYGNYFVAGTTIALRTIGAGSGTATYSGTVSATPTGLLTGVTLPGLLGVYPGDTVNVAPLGVAQGTLNNGNYEAVLTWSSNQVVLKDSRNITLYSMGVITNWRMLVESVPIEMQGKF